MAKQQQSIRDFSGGINRGANPKNLKDNQLIESKNFISDAVGQLTTIQDEVIVSTNSLNKTLPDGNQKNIHSWKTDKSFDLSQTSNITVPSIAENQVAKRARIRFYHSTDFGSHSIKSLFLDNLDRDERIFTWLNSVQNSAQDSYDDLEAQGNTVKTLEALANFKTSGSHTDESTIPWAWKYYSSNGVSFADEADGADHLSTSTASSNHNGTANQFVVKKIVDTDFGANVATYPVWMMELEFEYFGKINWELSGNWKSNYFVKPASGSQDADDGNTITWQNFNVFNINTTSFNQFSGHLFYNSLNASPVYGAFSKWTYTILNILSSKQHDYTITIDVWNDLAQSAHSTEILTYTNIQGETVDDVVKGLFGGTGLGEGEIISSNINEDQQVYWKRIDTGVEIFQDARTSKPYGIKNITVLRNNEVDITQTAGDKHAHLIAVGNSNSQASVYATETDQWTDYQVDLRTDNTDNTNNSDIGFFDSEGYLNVCDMSFRVNNKPKWFGHLVFNKTYIETDLMSPDFTTTDLAPVPYERAVTTGSVAQIGTSSNYLPQWSHMAMDVNDANAFFTSLGYANKSIVFGRSGATEDTSKIAVKNIHTNDFAMDEVGVKAYIQFLDDSATGDTDNNSAGTFKKTNAVELYFSYVYKGGYVSRPKRFQVDATDGSTNYQSTATSTDDRAMGIMVGIGRQLIDSNGTNAFNERLQGIEIWAKYTESDPSNIYLVCDIDLNKGWRSNLSGDWKPLSTLTISTQLKGYTTGNWPTSSGYTHYKRNNYLIFTSPNLIESFYQRYGLDYKDPIGFDAGATGWKTACIFNRRAYYGNIQIRGKDDSLTYKPDGILKSAPGNYLTVGVSNLIEATINDGDEITSLQVVGNKLCQFKKNSLAVMGIKILENGESREFIEQIIHYVGIESENQVCQTPYGLFWVSRSGVYMFNGEGLQRLTENPEGSTLSKQEWEEFYGARLHCGYDAYWNQVLIARDLQNNNETLIYSFNNRAFSSSNDLFSSSKKSGFAQAKNGQLIWAEEFNNSGSAGITGSKNNLPKNKSAGFTASTNAPGQNNLSP